MKYILILLFTFAFSENGLSQHSESWTDLDYAGDGKEYHKLDIYLPDGEKSSYPVVIAIYGSAWFGNNLKANAFKTMGQPLLDAGFAVVTPNHRSSMDAKFPAQINDIKAVIRFVRANAEKYQIDTSFVGITGSSSGGHLAALAGTSGGIGTYTKGSTTVDIEGNVGPDTSYSSSVDAVVDWFGPTNLLIMASCEGGDSFDHNADNSPGSNLIGGPVQENPDKTKLVNPITYTDSSDPPFLILHGEEDPVVPKCQSEILHEALQEAGVSSKYIPVPGGGHGPGVHTEENLDRMVSFFQREYNKLGVGILQSNTSDSYKETQTLTLIK